DGISRREILRVGGLGFTGLLWADLLRAKATASERPRTDSPRSAGSFGKAKACILIFNYGGPFHLDAWGLETNAPPALRRRFQPAATQIHCITITQHLPP